ncbi:MAG: hypothetical protein E7265_01390 [Lachnospiraceae bacterium]|nr:hypothetical protein [Lachnospiraceae bacterium]
MIKCYCIAEEYIKITAEPDILEPIDNMFSKFIVSDNEYSITQTFHIAIEEADYTDYLTISNTAEQNKQHCCIFESDYMSLYKNNEKTMIEYHSTAVVKTAIISTANNNAVIAIINISNNYDDMKFKEISYTIRDLFFYYIQKKNKIVIHSASIVYKDKAWLFSAPSGTGKSTHVNLWHELEFEAKDFNGDLAICYLNENNEVLAAGSPWCGTSGIFNNITAPLGGIIFINKGLINSIERISGINGALKIAARSVSPAWTNDHTDITLSVSEQIANKIILGNMICLPDHDAAITSKAFIDRYNV